MPNAGLDAPPPACPAREPNAPGNCASAADCAAPFDRCVLTRACEGWCARGVSGDLCTRNADCGEGLVCGNTWPDDRFVGYCLHPGELAAPCLETAECQAGLTCVRVTDALKQCSNSAENAPCGDAVACTSLHCIAFRCTTGHISSPCEADGDCDRGYCGQIVAANADRDAVLACVAGERLDPCQEDAQCLEGFCVAEPNAWGECQPGQLSQPCVADDDCASGECSGASPGSFGSCGDGTIESPCDSDAACASKICVEIKPRMGTCSTGAIGAQCIDANDCLSEHCQLQPDMGLPGACQP